MTDVKLVLRIVLAALVPIPKIVQIGSEWIHSAQVVQPHHKNVISVLLMLNWMEMLVYVA